MPGAYAHIAMARSLGTRKTLVVEYDIPSEISQIILEKPEYIELGAVSPDYPYLAKQNLWADNMHYKANGSLIKSGIDILAKESINDDATRKKIAWLLGFAAHVIADITVHPIVAGIIGPYEGNERAHRECEVNQDAYAFNKMNWGELCEVDCFETGIQQCSDPFGHLVPEVLSFWQQLLEINCATDYAVTLPHIGRWHVGYTNLMDNFAEEANRFSILAPFVVHFGLACPNSAGVDRRYISNLLTPTGNHIHYDELFNYAASNIGKVWGTIARGILGLDTEYETKIKNWNLDTGMDELNQLEYWR